MMSKPPENENIELPDDSGRSIDEQLVAYLDGELDAEAGRRVEEALATDRRLRRTLQGLDRTWELLDELDTAEVPESFTQTTLEMVTVAAAEDVRESLTEAPRRRRRRWVIAGGGLVAAALVGFLAVAWLAPNPNRQLVEDLPLLINEDLPMLVNAEQYRHVDDFQFLQMLSREGLFVEEDGNEQE